MYKQIGIIRKYRTELAELSMALTNEQLNTIPSGFSNNIIWHMGHLLVTLQGLSYKPAGLPFSAGSELWPAYKPGSVPGVAVNGEGVSVIRALLLSTLDQFEQDLLDNRFASYASWVTRTGIEMKSIEEALELITFHEGLHMGYIFSIKKLVTQTV